MKNCIYFILLFIFSLCFNFSCKKSNIKKEIKKIASISISFPQYTSAIVGGKLVYKPINVNTNKLLVYYDSSICGTCEITHIEKWEKIIRLSQDHKSFETIFILEPKSEDLKELKQILLSLSFDGTVYIDKTKEFSSKNPKIPKDNRFHILLLDKNNRVVLVGNPLASDAMWTLFKSTLDNMLAHDGVYVPE